MSAMDPASQTYSVRFLESLCQSVEQRAASAKAVQLSVWLRGVLQDFKDDIHLPAHLREESHTSIAWLQLDCEKNDPDWASVETPPPTPAASSALGVPTSRSAHTEGSKESETPIAEEEPAAADKSKDKAPVKGDPLEYDEWNDEDDEQYEKDLEDTMFHERDLDGDLADVQAYHSFLEMPEAHLNGPPMSLETYINITRFIERERREKREAAEGDAENVSE